MHTHLRRATRACAVAASLTLLVAACGDDDDAGGSPATTEAADETTTTAGEGGEFAEYCAVAEEINNQEDFPTTEQIERAVELAPDEIADAVDVAGPAFIEAEGDMVATFAAFARDDVEQAIFEINQFETEHCGIEHDEPAPGPNEPEEGAAVVDVTAVDYSFELPSEVAAGRTSFVMRNEGQEAHFMAIARIAEGHTLEEALQFDGDPEEAGLIEEVEGGESGLAAPGGEDVEVMTVDLEPGDYGMVCFVPGPDGSPHAFSGMAVPFTVS